MYTDKELINLLASNNKNDFNMAIVYLKKQMTNRINSLILKRGGIKEDAEELLNDALLVAWKYAKENRFKLNTDLKGFIYTVVRNLHQSGKGTISLSENLNLVEPTSSQSNEEKILKLEKSLQLLSEECRKVIFTFYYQKKSMKEIMRMFGLGSEQAAKNKKYRCMSELKKIYLKQKNM